MKLLIWKQEGLKWTPVGKIPVYLVWRFQWVVGNVAESPTRDTLTQLSQQCVGRIQGRTAEKMEYGRQPEKQVESSKDAEGAAIVKVNVDLMSTLGQQDIRKLKTNAINITFMFNISLYTYIHIYKLHYSY